MSTNPHNLTEDPKIIALTPALTRLRTVVRDLVIKDERDYAAQAAELKSIKDKLAAIKEAAEKITKPQQIALDAVRAQAKATAAPWLECERQIKNAMIAYSSEQDRLRREQQHRDNEAAERERKRQLEIADRARAKGREDKAALHEDRAAQIVAPIAPQAAPKIPGITFRKIWKFVVLDPTQIKREFMCADETKIGALVRSIGAAAEELVGGIKVHQEDVIASRSSRETGVE